MSHKELDATNPLLRDSIWVSPKMYRKLRWFFVFFIL